MNWISFIAWLGALYALYYFFIIVLDNTSSAAPAQRDSLPVLTFSETIAPEKISMEDFMRGTTEKHPESPSKALGGVSMDAIFDLARKDAIEYTRSVSF